MIQLKYCKDLSPYSTIPTEKMSNMAANKYHIVHSKLATILIIIILVKLTVSHPQNSRRRNLFRDQIASETGDGVVYLDDQIAMESHSGPYLEEVLNHRWPYQDQIAMENQPRPYQKAIYYDQPSSANGYQRPDFGGPTSLGDRWRQQDETSKNIQYKRGTFQDDGSRRNYQHNSFLHDLKIGDPRPNSRFPGSEGMSATTVEDFRDQEGRVGAPKCPPERDLLPCTCHLKGTEIHVKCDSSSLIKVQRGLTNLMHALLRVAELHLVANSLRNMPPRFFGSLQVNKLFLLNNDLASISRNSFAGLESSLEHLYIKDPSLYDLPFDTLDNLNNLKTFVLEDTLVSEIPRLYSHSKLEFLKIDGSRVTSIPSAAFKLMTKMKKVHLANSKINEIGESSLEGLVYLKELNLSNNAIEWIHPRAFRTMEVLEELTLSGNSIVDASMAVLAGREIGTLKKLDLSNNKIKFLKKGTFVDMKSVESIVLTGNSLTSIDAGAFSKMPNLMSIELNDNLLEELHADILDEAPNVAHLKAARNNLSHVSDIKFLARTMPNLRTLDLDDNNIELKNDKSFEGHSKLEVLRLNANDIKKLKKGAFKNMPSLRELHLSHNRIQKESEGPVWDLPKMKILDISHNDLENINAEFLTGMPMLTSLDVGFNMISNVQKEAFMEVAYLRSLNMSFNKISDLPADVFIGLRDLYELDLSYNEMADIKENIFRGLSSLEFLHITHNQIMKIEPNSFRDTSKLKELDLSTNILQQLPSEALKQLPSLRRLNLKRNAISSVSDGELSGLKIVERLDLSNNHIQSLGKEAFKDMSVLRDLDLSKNYIETLYPDMFSSMKLLERLNISHNYVSSLGEKSFLNAKRLRILDLTNNSLTDIGNAVQGLTSLQGLFLSHNYIDMLRNTSFVNLPALNVLYFDNNGLHQFEPGTFHNLTSLVFLDLGNNNLVELNQDSFQSHYSLKELKLNKNQISMIKDYAFQDLASIQSLELQDNVITYVGDKAFDFLPSLKFLNLSKNGLQDVPKNVLMKLPGLDVLDLSWNFILEIDDSTLTNQEWLTVLMLHHNDLCRLSDGAFSRQRGLRVLTLHSNQLRRLHLKALGQTIKGLSLLDMSDNPFSCDCELVWLREYIQEEEDKLVETHQAIEDSDTSGRGYRSQQYGQGNKLKKSRTRTFTRYRDALLDRAPLTLQQHAAFTRSGRGEGRAGGSGGEEKWVRSPLTDRNEFIDRYSIEGLVGPSEVEQVSLKPKQGITTEANLPMYLLGRSFSSASSAISESLPSLGALPMPLRKVPVCAGPQKYKGMPITEVPAEAFLCEGRPQSSASGGMTDACVPRFLDPHDMDSLSLTLDDSDPNSESFLDYNNPIVVLQLQSTTVSPVASSLSDIVTPPPLPAQSTTTTIIVVSSTPSDVDVQVTQQVSQELTGDKRAQQLDYNVVTGDTPTIYAGGSSSDTEDQEPSATGGLFGSLPSLPSILETIGSISNLKLPNIGLNMNWAKLPIGRLDSGSGLASKLGYPATDEDDGEGQDLQRPPLWIEGPNGPILNSVYIESHGHPIPSLKNAEKIYPTSILAPISPTSPSSAEEGRSTSIITFPDGSDGSSHGSRNKKNMKGPNPDTFRFPDEHPKLDARGQGGFVFPGNGPPGVRDRNPDHQPNVPPRRLPLPSMVHTGPGQNAGKPFLPGLSNNQVNVRPGPSHIIGARPGIGSVSKVSLANNPLHRQNTGTHNRGPANKSNKKTQWSSPEVINPLSGISLYQPSEQFKPYHPHRDNNPIQIITPPHSHAHNLGGLRPPQLPHPQHKQSNLSTDTNNTEEPPVVENADILSYANPTDSLRDTTAVQSVPFVPDLVKNHEADYKTDISTEQTTTALTNISPDMYYPDYDQGIQDILSNTQSIPEPGYIHTSTYPSPTTKFEYFEPSTYHSIVDNDTITNENASSTFPVQISDDDTHSIDDILDLLYAAEQEVAKDETEYDLTFAPVDNNETISDDMENSYHAGSEYEYSSGFRYNPEEDTSISIPPQIDDNLPPPPIDEFIASSELPPILDDYSTGNFYSDDILPPQLTQTTTEIHVPTDRLPPFQVTTTQYENSASDTFSTTRSSFERTQRPPTVYGNIKRGKNPIVLSDSLGNPDDFGPPVVGQGVSVLKGKPSADKVVKLHLETSAHRTRQDGETPLLISPDLDDIPEVAISEEGLIGNANPLQGTVDGSQSYPGSNVIGEVGHTRRLPVPSEHHSLFQHSDKSHFDTVRYGNQQRNPPSGSHGTFHGVGVPTISRVRPATVTVVEDDYAEEGPLPSLSPGLAAPPPTREEEHPRVALRQHHESQHQESEPKRVNNGQESPLTASRFGTLDPNAGEGPAVPVNEAGIDWYFNNYYKDYGNGTDIPIGRNKPVVRSIASSVLECKHVLVLNLLILGIASCYITRLSM